MDSLLTSFNDSMEALKNTSLFTMKLNLLLCYTKVKCNLMVKWSTFVKIRVLLTFLISRYDDDETNLLFTSNFALFMGQDIKF